MVVTILAEKMAMRSFRLGEDMLISHKRRMGSATKIVSATISAVRSRVETVHLENGEEVTDLPALGRQLTRREYTARSFCVAKRRRACICTVSA